MFDAFVATFLLVYFRCALFQFRGDRFVIRHGLIRFAAAA